MLQEALILFQDLTRTAFSAREALADAITDCWR
jgi:hypothetical protein